MQADDENRSLNGVRNTLAIHLTLILTEKGQRVKRHPALRYHDYSQYH
ncbi:MAG: hypothetical protein ACYS8S_07765 [Planctomycetota bacterium]